MIVWDSWLDLGVVEFTPHVGRRAYLGGKKFEYLIKEISGRKGQILLTEEFQILCVDCPLQGGGA